MLRAILLMLALVFFLTPAKASPICERFGSCLGAIEGQFSARRSAKAKIVGARPRGCPRKHCGCSLSIKLFGKIVPKLNLAWNWAKAFPRTSPRPRAVAVRRGHVFQLLSHAGGHKWLVWDANSGGGLTRIHVRSVRGYVFVDPHAKNYAFSQ